MKSNTRRWRLEFAISWFCIQFLYGVFLVWYTISYNLANMERLLSDVPSWSKLPVWIGIPFEILALFLAGWTLYRQSPGEWYAWQFICSSRVIVGIVWIFTPYATGWTGPPLPGGPPLLSLVEVLMIGFNITCIIVLILIRDIFTADKSGV